MSRLHALNSEAILSGAGQSGLFHAGSTDFRSVLAAFYRPGALRLALAPLVAGLWRNRGRCAHRLPSHWCRRREREIREVALGRIG